MPEAVTTSRRRVCPARAGHGILERGGACASGAHAHPAPHIPTAHGPRRRSAPRTRLASGAGAGWPRRRPRAARPAGRGRPGRGLLQPSTRSPSRATAGVTAWACRSGAPTATPSTAGTTRPILKHYYTGISFSNVADSIVRVNLRSGLSAVKLTCAQRLHRPGHGRGLATIPAGTTATTTYTQPRLPRRRGLRAQDLHRRPDLHAHQRARSASSPRRTSATTAPTAARSGSCTAAGS